MLLGNDGARWRRSCSSQPAVDSHFLGVHNNICRHYMRGFFHSELNFGANKCNLLKKCRIILPQSLKSKFYKKIFALFSGFYLADCVALTKV